MRTKIVHYMSTLKGGGAQTQLILLCNGTDLEKFDVSIICWDDISSIPLRKEIKVIKIPRGSKYNLPGFALKIYKATKLLRPDIAHLWLPEVLTLPGAIAAKMLNIPSINSERRLPVTKFGITWLRDRSEYLIHLLATKVTTNFPVPIERRSVFNTLLNGKKGVTIYNGLELEKLAALRQEKNYHEKKLFKLVYCGRLVAQKNVNLLITAIKQLKDEGYRIQLDIYGNGEKETELKQMVQDYRLVDEVNFNGYHGDWKKAASGADCFILPTNREGMPNVLFEAIAIGLPIISTTIEEISVHFKNHYDAILVPPDDAAYIAGGIKEAIDDADLLKKIKVNAMETVKKYTVRAMVDAYEKLYADILFQKNKG